MWAGTRVRIKHWHVSGDVQCRWAFYCRCEIINRDTVKRNQLIPSETQRSKNPISVFYDFMKARDFCSVTEGESETSGHQVALCSENVEQHGRKTFVVKNMLQHSVIFPTFSPTHRAWTHFHQNENNIFSGKRKHSEGHNDLEIYFRGSDFMSNKIKWKSKPYIYV